WALRSQNSTNRSVIVAATPPSLTSTLSHTTLFRSVFAGSAKATKESDHQNDAAGRQAEVTGGVVALDLHVVGVGPEGTVASDPKDRKSTRLNSSHVKISYAVFCLKTNNNTMPATCS